MATSDDLQAASRQPSLSVDATLPRSGRLGNFPSLVVLDSGAGVSSIPEPVLSQTEGPLPGAQLGMFLQRGTRTILLANGRLVSVAHKTTLLQLTVHIPWGPVVLDQERYPCMPYSDSVMIVGSVILDKLGLNFKDQMFELARASRA